MASGFDIVRSPRQAATIFGLDGARPPRQKNLFIVNFVKNGDMSGSGFATGSSGSWSKDLGFLVKSVDRPSIDPKTEEINQYNKKRIVHTGYKIGATRFTLYDTADSMAMRMWNEYAQFYFGDFRHVDSADMDWQFDTVSPQFLDSSYGYGFSPASRTNSPLATTSDLSIQYFFKKISVYQVMGGNFVQFDLINPKITGFDPDELDYSNSDVATISCTVQSEAVIYVNDFRPIAVDQDPFLLQAFGDTRWFDGDVVDYPEADSGMTAYPGAIYPQTTDFVYRNPVATPSVPLTAYAGTTSSSTGAIGAFGRYDFGSTTTMAPQVLRPLSTDLALAATTNPALASVLKINAAAITPDSPVQQLINPYGSPTSIAQDTYDEAAAAVQAIGGQGQDNTYAQAVTYGVISSALASQSSPRDQIYNRNPEAANGTNSWSSQSGQGLALSRQGYGIVNAQRPPASQIGFNYATTGTRVAGPTTAGVPVNGGTVPASPVQAQPTTSSSGVKMPGGFTPLD